MMDTQKELPEMVYDEIMSEARKIFLYQEKVGNPYAMHQAIEWANREINRVMNMRKELTQ